MWWNPLSEQPNTITTYSCDKQIGPVRYEEWQLTEIEIIRFVVKWKC